MNWLDDKNIFNWGRSEDSDMADDVFFFLDKFYNNISGRSRSGSVSESDSKPSSRNRSRTNSFTSLEGYKVEGMTSLPTEQEENKPLLVARNVTSRRMFRIDDVEEEDDEEELGQLAVAQGHTYQSKKHV